MATWQHLRSSTANKRPTTSLADGRIAINTNTASPGLFFKDSAGTGIVKVGPVHVGTTAPNSVPAAGGSSGNYLGEQWLDTSVSPAQMKVWNGSTWIGVVADELPVSKLQDGAARQLIQTDAAGTGVEWTSNVDVPGTLDVTSTATFDSIAQYPLGSAGAPTITFTGDNNTGIYSPGADQVAISTGGSGRLFVDANGNVGVNTASITPVGDYRFLAINGAGTGGGAVVSFRNTSAGEGAFASYNPGASFNVGSIQSIPLIFTTNNSERLRITSAGLVGVGTSSPSAVLYVNNASGVDPSLTYGATAGQTFKNGTTELAFGAATTAPFAHWMQARFSTNAAQPLLLNPLGGNVGIGTTSPGGKLQINTQDGFLFDVGAGAYAYMRFGSQGAGEGVAELANERTTGKVFLKTGVTGSTLNTRLEIDGAGATIINNQSGSERARIDSSGRLLVGTSSARAVEPYASATNGTDLQHVIEGTGTTAGIVICSNNSGNIVGATVTLAKANGSTIGSNTLVANGDTLGTLAFAGADGTDIRTKAAAIYAEVDGTPGANDMPGRLVFSTTADGASSPTERMRLNNTGVLATYGNGDTIFARSGAAAGTASACLTAMHSATSTTTGTTSLRIYTNGNVENTNNSYGAFSDAKLKENIVDANSQWSDIKALQVRKYNFKEGQTHTQIGLVAQEVELVSPGLVTESPDRDEDGNDLGTITKSVNYSVLYMKAVKALQEAMERIETLEAKVAALESA